MNFDEVIACLENTGNLEVFIARLKKAGKHSSPFLHLQNSMNELKMHPVLCTPRGIHQKTIIQHTLRFSDAEDCFLQFRLVCKSWKDAVETIQFNRTFECQSFLGNFYDIDDCSALDENISLPTNYLEKYLKVFKKLTLPVNLEFKNEIFALVLNNMKKLNKIHFLTEGEPVKEEFTSFISELLHNSQKTLQRLNPVNLIGIADIAFSKLTTLDLFIGEEIRLPQFQDYFPKALKNMENLETVEVRCARFGFTPICQHIFENYEKHCISSDHDFGDNIVPVKILQGITMQDFLVENTNNVSHLLYVHVLAETDENGSPQPQTQGWERYQEIFDECVNLKAIELEQYKDDFVTKTLPNFSQANQEIWKERISYFQARGIRIADRHEIYNNEDLRLKLAKEAGVTWKFHFRY
jgi:hypothetical protein